ncbi:MAG TPA: amino acid permease [Ferruginibacter sp.]|nr:amino acid permease [Ferruginibacter sp.]HMP20213.1 amino acid permease [Ferruginibacter sp.]
MPVTAKDEGLKRVIGVPGLTLSVISGVIGAGIFALPAIAGMALGAFAVVAYMACGILFAAILFCYAEIGSRVTSSGGSYAYVEAAFGTLPGYIINWMYFLGWGIIGSAALMNIITDSLAVLYPAFTNPYLRGALFFVLTVIMVVVNITGAKQAVVVVKTITILKLLPLFGIIIFGFRYVQAANLHWEQLPSFKTFADTTLVLFFAFAGFETSLGASGEIKNPKQTVPLSIGIAGITVLALYLQLQTVVQGVLGADMATHKAAPLAAVAQKIIGPVGSIILVLCAALSCFGNITLDILCTPRCLFAGANTGAFPKFLGRLHPKFGTPYLAITSYGALIFIFSITGGFQQLAIMASTIILLVYLAVMLATVKLRQTKISTGEKYYKAPGGIITPLIGIAAIVWLLTSLGRWEIFSTLLFIFVTGIVYFATHMVKNKRSKLNQANHINNQLQDEKQ